MLVLSDLNGSYGSTTYAPEVHRAIAFATTELRPDLVLIAGDMIAGQAPQLADSAVRAMWQAFDSAVTAPLRAAGIPMVVTLGNHDASAYATHARDRRLAAEYWQGDARAAIADAVEDADFPFRYSVRRGNTFIAVWDATNEESTRRDTLVEWLRTSLASEPARSARHRLVLVHLPLYGVAVGRNQRGEVLADGDSLRQKLEEWGATVVVSGHQHAYYPARRGRLDLLYSGALGDGPRVLVGGMRAPYKALTVLELRQDGARMSTFRVDSSGTMTPVPLDALPPAICGYGGWVMRHDLRLAGEACAR